MKLFTWETTGYRPGNPPILIRGIVQAESNEAAILAVRERLGEEDSQWKARRFPELELTELLPDFKSVIIISEEFES